MSLWRPEPVAVDPREGAPFRSGLERRFVVLVAMLLLAVGASAAAGLVGIARLERSLRELTQVEAQRLLTITHIRRLFRSEVLVAHQLERSLDASRREALRMRRDELQRERNAFLRQLRALGVPGQAQALERLERDHRAIVERGRRATLTWEEDVATILQTTEKRLLAAADESRERSRASRVLLLLVSILAASLAILLGAIALRRVQLHAQALAEREAQLRLVVQSAPSLLAILSPEGKLEYLPPRGPAFLGRTFEEIAADPWGWVQEEDRGSLQMQVDQAGAGKQVGPARVVGIRNDGSRWHASTSATPLLDAQGQPAGVILQILDITDQCRAEQAQRELEDQLRQAQRLEVVGRLAGGVAHDFNNLLTAIKGYASLAQQDPKTSEMPVYLEAIETAADRAAALTRQLLTFSRKQVISPVPTHLGALVEGLTRLLVPVLGEDVHLEIKTAPDLGLCLVDVGQVEQVVLNLVVNARQAMPTGGRVIIEIDEVDLDTDYSVSHPGVQAGPYVSLTVRDTGVGMSPEVQRQAFDPFFTTKPVGQGTGLGLSVVQGTVQQHGGAIELRSEPGVGTQFRSYWPRLAGQATAAAPAAPPAHPPRGDEAILLVEDASLVRGFATAALKHMGYHVLVAETAQQALALAENLLEPPGLLLTDVILPDKSGPELAELLRGRFPRMPVLFTSGYSDRLLSERGHLPEGIDYLPKPYHASVLAHRVRQAIDGSLGPAGAAGARSPIA